MMCGLVGILPRPDLTDKQLDRLNSFTVQIFTASSSRGSDGFGYITQLESHRALENYRMSKHELEFTKDNLVPLIANFRAEPTTEYVENKSLRDQQPYEIAGKNWAIVHNGTISNDKDLRTYEYDSPIDSAAIIEQLALGHRFDKVVDMLEGSYAILAISKLEKDKIWFATNYKPIWFAHTEFATFLASSRHFFPDEFQPKRIKPDSTGFFKMHKTTYAGPNITRIKARERGKPHSVLMVASGGLDSTVAAAALKSNGYGVTLLHFNYNARCWHKELEAIKNIAGHLRVPVIYHDLRSIFESIRSSLIGDHTDIAEGKTGAEFPHEWVPGRNLIMLSIASAICENNGIGYVGLGNNLEEAGAFPDNEPEFIDSFAEVLPLSSLKPIGIKTPVGNLVKHEIVKLGKWIDAPMHLTWSCYRNGEKHCGRCGPCYMRKKAFAISNIPDPMEYEN